MSDAWWRDAVIYQIYPRSFADSNGDEIGDLRGIAGKLDYIARLGVDGVWLSPFFVSPMADFGYDVADYCDVDPSYGTLADFDALVARGHALGLKIVLDMVWGHTSDRHPWFRESRASRVGPRADWYVWAEPRPDGAPPNNWLSVFGGGAWSWEKRRRQYYLHPFLAAQPKLNLANPQVMAALLEVAAFWLDRGVDGFRLDAVDFFLHDAALRDNPPRSLAEVPVEPYHMQRHLHDLGGDATVGVFARIRALTDRNPEVVTIAEIGTETTDTDSLERVARYRAGGSGVHAAYSLSQMKSTGDAAAIRSAIAEVERRLPAGGMVWAFSNHDVARVVSRWGDGSAAAAKLFMALLLSLRGAVFMYQGEELGLPEAEVPPERLRDPYGLAYWPDFKGRDGSRTPMPWRHDERHAGFSTASETWLPVPAAHQALAADRQDGDPGSVLNAWRAFLALRRQHAALRHGTLRLHETSGPLIAFERRHEGERLYCAFNLGTTPLDLAAPQGEILPMAGFARQMAVGQVRLQGYGAIFMELPGA